MHRNLIALALVAPFALAPFALATPGLAQPREELDWRRAPNALNVELEVRVEDGTAVFSWDLDDPAARCAIDVDGDGVLDHELDRCRPGRVTHQFDHQGVFFATLVAEAPDGRRGIARVPVRVE